MSSAPAWFTDALATAPEEITTVVDGVPITSRAWGHPASQGIVLVHGGAAHARWWDHVAPLLAADRRVVALDLSGHGDSGRRSEYDLDVWGREVLEVAANAGIHGAPTVIGHSMGGFVALRLASMHGSRLAGVIVIDSPVRDITPEERAALEHRAFGPLRVYPTRADALAQFHPIPDQPTVDYIAEHVAETSVQPVDGGWTWKFDPQVFARPPMTPELLTRLECRVALFRAEHGILTPQATSVMYDRLGRAAPTIEIPAAGHHVMLDEPLALITGIRTLLSDWDHSLPDVPAGSAEAPR